MTNEQDAVAIATRAAERMLRGVVRTLTEQARDLNPSGREDDDRGGRAATLNRAIGVLATNTEVLLAEACEHDPTLTEQTLTAVLDERRRHTARWGLPQYPDGTGPQNQELADEARAEIERKRAEGTVTRYDMLAAQVAQVAAAQGTDLATALIQHAERVVAWHEDLVRRGAVEK